MLNIYLGSLMLSTCHGTLIINAILLGHNLESHVLEAAVDMLNLKMPRVSLMYFVLCMYNAMYLTSSAREHWSWR